MTSIERQKKIKGIEKFKRDCLHGTLTELATLLLFRLIDTVVTLKLKNARQKINNIEIIKFLAQRCRTETRNSCLQKYS